MSAKPISEATGKSILNRFLSTNYVPSKCASVNEKTDWPSLLRDHPWLQQEKLVVKPDQLIKRRGKLGLIGVNLDLAGVQRWINERINKEIKVNTKGFC